MSTLMANTHAKPSMTRTTWRRNPPRLMAMTAILGALSFAEVALAQSCTPNPNGETRYALPAATEITTSWAIGSPASPWVYIPASSNRLEFSGCSAASPLSYGITPSAPALPGAYSEDGRTYSVFDTGVPGLGVVLRLRDQGYGGEAAIRSGSDAVVLDRAVVGNLAGAFHVRFIKTGEVQLGDSTTRPFTIGDAFARDASGTARTRVVFDASQVRSTLGETCSIPASIPVDLGNHRVSMFNAVGSASPWVDFNLPLRNCPANYSQLTYRLIPLDGLRVGADGAMLDLRQGGATGVAVQVWDGYHDIAAHFIGGQALMNLPPGTANVDIPMRARIRQLDSTVTPGDVATAMEVRIEYR